MLTVQEPLAEREHPDEVDLLLGDGKATHKDFRRYKSAQLVLFGEPDPRFGLEFTL